MFTYEELIRTAQFRAVYGEHQTDFGIGYTSSLTGGVMQEQEKILLECRGCSSSLEGQVEEGETRREAIDRLKTEHIQAGNKVTYCGWNAIREVTSARP